MDVTFTALCMHISLRIVCLFIAQLMHSPIATSSRKMCNSIKNVSSQLVSRNMPTTAAYSSGLPLHYISMHPGDFEEFGTGPCWIHAMMNSTDHHDVSHSNWYTIHDDERWNSKLLRWEQKILDRHHFLNAAVFVQLEFPSTHSVSY